MAITPRTATVAEATGTSAFQLAANMSTAQVGDYVVMSVAADTTINTPSGWTQLLYINQVVDYAVFGRFLTGTTGDNAPTVTKTDTGSSNRLSVIVEPFGGVDTTTPLDVATPVTNNGAASSSIALSGLTTVTAGAMVISGAAIDASSATQAFSLSWTGGTEVMQTTGTGRRQEVAQKSMASAGASGTATWTQGGGTSLHMVGFQLALRPASGGGGGGETQLDITYVGSGAWAAGAASPSALNPTGLADGDKLYALVHSRESPTSLPATVGVWTKAHEQAIGSGTVGAGTGPTRFTVYEADATASMSGAAAGLTSLGTLASLIRVHAFRAPAGATGLTWSRAFAFYSHASSTNIGGTTSSSIDLAAKDSLLVAHGSPDDTTTSLPLTSVSATGITFGTITDGAVLSSGTGNDHAAASYVVPVTAGSGTSAVTLAGTANAAETGGSIVLRIRLTGTVAVSPPVATAGADATVTVNQNFSRLGTGTNSPTSYLWTIQAGPTGVGTTIDSDAQLDWAPTVAGTYTLRFAATNSGGTGTDDLILTVNPAAPVADAGVDASGYTNNAFTRTGSGTNTPTSYEWKIQSGPASVGSIIGTAAALNWTPTVAGTYVLRFTATNASGSGFDDMTYTVSAQAAPTVSAGVDASGTAGTAFTRTATESANGSTITARSWTIVSGPFDVGASLGTAAALNWTPSVPGTFTIRYSATNGIGTTTDDAVITVGAASADPTMPELITAYASGGRSVSTSWVSPSFTPEPGEVIIVKFVNGYRNDPVANTPTGTGLTFTNPTGVSGQGGTDTWGDATVYVATAGQNPSATTVTCPVSTSGTHAFLIERWRNATVAATPATNATKTDNSAPYAQSVTTTQENSVVTAVIADYNAINPGTPTYSANNVASAAATYASGSMTGYWIYCPAPTAGAYTVGVTAPSGQKDTIAAMEILGVASGVAAPTASAGADVASHTVNTQFTRAGGETGSGIAERQWKITAGPAGVGTVLTTLNTLNWTPTVVGTYTLEYSTGNTGGVATDQVSITVISAVSPPVANAGADATIDNAATFTRTGSGTNTPTGYAWTIVSGPTGVTAGTNIGNAAALSYTPTIAGTYVLRLTATNAGGSGTDDLTLTVNALPNVSTLTDDFATTIDTGKWSQYTPGSQSISGGRFTVVPVSTYSDIASIANLNLIGSGAFVEVPTVPNVADGTTQAYFTLRNALDSSYKIEFTWINNNLVAQRSSGGASTQILSAAYNATNHRFWRIREASGTIYFDTSPDSSTWTNFTTVLVSAVTGFTPGAVEIVMGAGFYGTAPSPGTAQFDNLNLTVSPPVATAGADANITLGQTFSRTGSGTNSPTGYAWTIVSGPAGVTPGTNIGNAAALSYQPTIVGTYVLRLTATNIGGSGTDDLTLTVSYDTPTASAGSDAAIDLGAAFNRTATEDAKTAPVTSRAWTVLSGPNQVGNTLATAALVNWTPTVAGTYVLRYTFVTDGGSVTDDVQVTVTHQLPTANAGVDGSTLVNQLFTRTATETGFAITARAWTIQGGPTGVGSTIGTAAALSFTPTQPGSYTLRYTVTNAAGSVWDEMILTVNGPPVVEIGANISVDNRVNVSRNATETGGGGVTAREWKITAGPQINTVIGNTSLLDWTPTIPGTYTIQYSATNPYGTGTDTLTVTVAAIVIGLASTSGSVSSIVNPNLARRARITVAGTSIGVSALASAALLRARKLAGTKAAVSSFTAGKPRNVTTHPRTVSAVSSVATAALTTRRTFQESVVEQSSATATAKLKLVTKGSGTGTQTTATVSGTIASARKLAGYSGAVDSLASATLRRVSNHVRTLTAQSTATLGLRLASALSQTITGEAIVRNANLGVQQPGGAQATAVSSIEGSIVSVPRLARTVTAVSSTSRKLGRAEPLTATATANSLISQKLNGVLREHETIVQAGLDYTVQLGVAVLLIYEGMIARGVVYMEESAGILRQLSGLARAVSQTPPVRLNRATNNDGTASATSATSSVVRRVRLSAGTSQAYNFVGGANLVRLRTLSPNQLSASSSVGAAKINRIGSIFSRTILNSSTSRKLNSLTRFRLVTILARSRFQERSGFAALTTAKAVTTSPQNSSRYIRKVQGYVTAQPSITGDLVVALPRVGYAEVHATATGNLVRVDPLEKTLTVDARATGPGKGVGKLSTIIRIFENEELDAYINQENYTGLNIVAVAPPEPEPVTVFRRTFTRPR